MAKALQVSRIEIVNGKFKYETSLNITRSQHFHGRIYLEQNMSHETKLIHRRGKSGSFQTPHWSSQCSHRKCKNWGTKITSKAWSQTEDHYAIRKTKQNQTNRKKIPIKGNSAIQASTQWKYVTPLLAIVQLRIMIH